MIIQTVHKTQFIDAFKSWDTYANNFSYEGLELLYNYFDDMDAQEPIGLDVVAICCEFCEMSLDEVLSNYDVTDETLNTDNETELLELATDYLEENTFLVGLTSDNTFVFQQF
jgi:hypothetical protein